MELGGRRAQHAREHLRRRRLLEMLHARKAEARRREAAKGRGASVLGRLVVVAQRVQRARDHLARTCTVAALRRRARSLDHSPHAHTHAHLVWRKGGIRLWPFPEEATPSRLAGVRRKRPIQVICLHPAGRSVHGRPREDGREHVGRGLPGTPCWQRAQVQRTTVRTWQRAEKVLQVQVRDQHRAPIAALFTKIIFGAPSQKPAARWLQQAARRLVWRI